MKAMKSRAYLEKLIAKDPERVDLPDASGRSNQLSQSPASLMLATGPKAVNRCDVPRDVRQRGGEKRRA